MEIRPFDNARTNPTLDRLRLHAATQLLDAKRKQGGSASRDGWFQYYAGYTSKFALDILRAANLPPGAVVLDPWNGSGTTTLAATQVGLHGVGVDINPVAVLISKAKLAHPEDAANLSGLLKLIEDRAIANPAKIQQSEPLLKWLHPSVAGQFRSIERAIAYALVSASANHPPSPLRGSWPPLASFLLVCLMRAARLQASVRIATNPTWIRPPSIIPSSSIDLAIDFKRIVRKFGIQLLRWKLDPGASNTAQVILGDSRALPLEKETVDFVLTSPPYCTRIDYVVNTAFELAALGISDSSTSEYTKLRRTYMGTPLTRQPEIPEIPITWPVRVKDILGAIRSHPSKASQSYYFKTYHQYFSDCIMSLGEIRRCLKPQGVAILVIQTSYYKELEIDLPDLFVQMGEATGLRAEILSSNPVLKFLTQINPRASRHRAERNYLESVVLLENPPPIQKGATRIWTERGPA